MILVVGAGAFGLPAALALRARGHDVTLIDPGPLPRPEASSTDMSRAVRMDYGSDRLYVELAARALEGWRRWNAEAEEELYREDGMLFLTRTAWGAGEECYESKSHAALTDRGARVERLDREDISARFPAFRANAYVDGYLSRDAGWADAARTMAWLVSRARGAGIEVRGGVTVKELAIHAGRVRGVETNQGPIDAETVLVATGAWTPDLLPWLAHYLSPSAQPVVYLRAPGDAQRWRAPSLPVWAADISTTGWYGFPASADGVLKVGHHSLGRIHPADGDRGLPQAELERVLAFVRRDLPALAGATLVGAKLCLYCDTPDGDFWIDHDPEHPGLVVATGGSGHGFKFAPVLGELIADVVERRENPEAERFRWREATGTAGDASRFQGE